VNIQEKISPQEIKKHLHTSKIGADIYVFDKIESTNNYAKKLAIGSENHGSVIIAETQTAGRGRLGRSFFSPHGSGVYMSIVLRPELDINKTLLITTMAAVALCRAIDNICDVNTQIKWVNDIYINNKKLCGILAESVVDPTNGDRVVILGIGVNVTTKAFSDDIKDIATALCEHTSKQINRNELIAAILNELEIIYDNILSVDFIEEYKKRSCVIGKEVFLIRGDEKCKAFVLDIDTDGALIIKNENGETEHINTGEISIRFD